MLPYGHVVGEGRRREYEPVHVWARGQARKWHRSLLVIMHQPGPYQTAPAKVQGRLGNLVLLCVLRERQMPCDLVNTVDWLSWHLRCHLSPPFPHNLHFSVGPLTDSLLSTPLPSKPLLCPLAPHPWHMIPPMSFAFSQKAPSTSWLLLETGCLWRTLLFAAMCLRAGGWCWHPPHIPEPGLDPA